MVCDTPHLVSSAQKGPDGEFLRIPVPCGKCPVCKARRVATWVFRLLQEDKVSSSAHFVTLTYDTKSVPISEHGFPTLRKSDFQKYMKRLRKLVPNANLKYYAAGEYGTLRHRPHYHAIIFNVPLERYFKDAWTIDGTLLGDIHVGSVTGDSIAYTMKYIDKPPGPRLYGSRDDREKEFSLMSKGLGFSYVTAEKYFYHKEDLSRLYMTEKGGRKIPLARYYRKKIYSGEDLGKQLEIIKQAVADAEIIDRLQFDAIGYGDLITYEQWKDSQKFGRFHAFYSQQKNREL